MSARRIAGVGAVGGLLAGSMMAMTEMIYGWVSSARTFWDAPMAIWAWVAGLDWFGQPSENVGSIVLGIGGHMLNSALAGVIFATVATALALRGLMVPLAAGVAYGLGLWIVMRYGILPLRDPQSTLFTTDQVSPQWVWWLAHAILGMTAGLVYAILGREPRRTEVEHMHEFRRAA